MLRFGLQGFHLQALHAPRARELRPSAEFLAQRFELFRKAGSPVLRPAASADVEDAWRWYEARREGLGDERGCRK